MLFISARTLSEYENGRLIPPDDVVAKMVEVYNAPWLAYQHLKNNTEIGRRFLPDINMSDLAKSILRLQKEDKKKRLEWIRDLEKQLEEAKEHENAVVKIES